MKSQTGKSKCWAKLFNKVVKFYMQVNFLGINHFNLFIYNLKRR